jgi:hypothetical protein
MPRDSNGVYTLPNTNPVQPGTIIASNWANPTMEDIGSELTNSLPRDGSAPMINALKGADGSAAGPGFTFSSDSSTGVYRDISDPDNPKLGLANIGVKKGAIGTWFAELLTRLKVPAIEGAQQSISVDPTVGVANPSSPLTGQPFDTLANAINWLNTIKSANSWPITVTLTAAKTYPITANLTCNCPVDFVSSIPGTKYIISGNFQIALYANSNITDATLTSARIKAINSRLTISNCNGTAALNSDSVFYIGEGAEAIFQNSITLTRGTIIVYANSFANFVVDITLSDGSLSISENSSVIVNGNCTITRQAGPAVQLTDQGSLVINGDTSLTGGNATNNILSISAISLVRLLGVVTITGNTGTVTAIVINHKSVLVLAGTGGFTVNSPGSNAVQSSLQSILYVPAGKTIFTVSGAAKTFLASMGGMNILLTTPTGTPVYAPALGTANSNLALNTASSA